jgi:hypothetical protein
MMRIAHERRRCDACGQPLPQGRRRDIRDFWFFDGIPPRGISISNIDGAYEDAPTDRIILFETKQAAEPLKRGQLGLLTALARRDGITVVLLRAAEPYVQVERIGSGVSTLWTYQQLRAALSDWFLGLPWPSDPRRCVSDGRSA